MFDILRICMWWFKSYYGEHEFWFPEGIGLYYLTGRNEDSPGLGANACGKTSLVDAIYWCFYGTSTRGIKAANVVHWGTQSCKVEVDVTVGLGTFTIARGQNPNFLTIDGQKATQDQVDKLLRMNDEAFKYAIFIPQFGTSFFDLLPAAKLSLFASIMQLDFWLERSKRASSKAERISTDMRKEEAELNRAEGRREEAIAGLKELRRKSDQFVDDRKVSLKALKKQISKHDERVTDLKDALPALRKAEQAAARSLDSLKQGRQGLELTYFDERRDAASLQGDYDRVTAKLAALQDDHKHFDSLRGKICPTCLQVVDGDHLKKQGDKIEALREKDEQEADDIYERLERAKGRRKKLKRQMEESDGLLRLASDKVTGTHHARVDCDNALTQAERDLKKAQLDYDTLQAAQDPFEALLDKRRDDINAYEKDIEESQDEIARLKEHYDAVFYWVAGFKRIRLFVIERTLKQLEIETNNNLTQLGLIGWEIQLDIERENKSGGITKGFTVLIYSPRHTEPVPYEAFSGGEIQRIRLAGDLAVSNMILERVGLTSGIEMHDEPSEHLSAEGMADLIDNLRERADRENKKVWLVDHHAFDSGEFAGVLTAVMAEESSSLEYEEILA